MAGNKEAVLVVDGINAVPEGCIAAIAALATPVDACRLAVVSNVFRSASDSDVVWERFLPPDCEAILARSDGGEDLLAELQSKKQLYMNLADRYILVDGDTKSFWLEKSNGKKCWMLSARSLTIIWGCTPRYWTWTSMPESRFPEVAKLIKVCLLEIRGTIKASMLSPATCYAAYLVFDLTEYNYGLDYISEASVSRSGARTEMLNGCLRSVSRSGAKTEMLNGCLRSELETYPRNRIPQWRLIGWRVQFQTRKRDNGTQCPKQRRDGWNELKIGEFYIKEGEEDEIDLKFMVKGCHWKRGLIVEGIELRPL